MDVDQTDQESIDAAAAYVVEHESELPPYFISAMNISAEQHVHVLAAAQRNVDNSVSKTCNGAVNDTVESVDQSLSAWPPAGLQSRQLLSRRLAREPGANFDEG